MTYISAADHYLQVRNELSSTVSNELFYDLIKARVATLSVRSDDTISQLIASTATEIKSSNRWIERTGKDFGLKERLETGCGAASGEEHCFSQESTLGSVVSFCVNQKGMSELEALELCLGRKTGDSISWFGRYMSVYYYKA